MMLIIEIHAETIEESNSSTHPKWEDEHNKKTNKNLRTSRSRFWEAIKLSIPGSLITQNTKNDE